MSVNDSHDQPGSLNKENLQIPKGFEWTLQELSRDEMKLYLGLVK